MHNKTLMPALQSPWFAPHVIVYMFAYALFGAAALLALTPATAFADFSLRILHTNDVHARYDQTLEDGSTCAARRYAHGCM